MKTFDECLVQQMQDPDFVREYEQIQPEREVMRAMGQMRAKHGMSQEELSRRFGQAIRPGR